MLNHYHPYHTVWAKNGNTLFILHHMVQGMFILWADYRWCGLNMKEVYVWRHAHVTMTMLLLQDRQPHSPQDHQKTYVILHPKRWSNYTQQLETFSQYSSTSHNLWIRYNTAQSFIHVFCIYHKVYIQSLTNTVTRTRSSITAFLINGAGLLENKQTITARELCERNKCRAKIPRTSVTGDTLLLILWVIAKYYSVTAYVRKRLRSTINPPSSLQSPEGGSWWAIPSWESLRLPSVSSQRWSSLSFSLSAVESQGTVVFWKVHRRVSSF